jgi:hypothetical protein
MENEPIINSISERLGEREKAQGAAGANYAALSQPNTSGSTVSSEEKSAGASISPVDKAQLSLEAQEVVPILNSTQNASFNTVRDFPSPKKQDSLLM